MRLRTLAAIVAFLVFVPSVAAVAQEPADMPPEVLDTLGMTIDQFQAVEPNPAWDGLGLFSPDAQRILASAGQPVDFITYAFGDDPNGTPIIHPDGATPADQGSMLWQLPSDWTPPAEGLNDTMAFAQNAGPKLQPGDTIVLMWIRTDTDFDFTAGLTINEGFPLTLPDKPVWHSTFAGDTWEGANLIPNAVFADRTLTFDVKSFDGATGFPTIELPGFYYRSADIMAMAVSATALAELVPTTAPASAAPGAQPSGNQDLLFRGASRDAAIQQDLLNGFLDRISLTAYNHLTEGKLFTAGFVFLATTRELLHGFRLLLNARLTLARRLLEKPDVTEAKQATSDSTPTLQPAAGGPTNETGIPASGGGSSKSISLLAFLIAFAIAIAVVVIRSKHRSRATGTTSGPPESGGLKENKRDDPGLTPPVTIPSSKEKEQIVRPLIFVPGIMASAIQANTSHGPEPIWPPLGFNLDIGKSMEALEALNPSDMSVLTGDTHGLLPGIHLGLIDFLEGHGYSLNPVDGHRPNLYIHAYNWLESCSLAATGLVELINRATSEHGMPPSIICHSMGGLVVRAALNGDGPAVDRVFYDASPHLGAPMAYYSLHPDIPYEFLPGVAGIALNAAYSIATAGGGSISPTKAFLKTLASPEAAAIAAAAQAIGGGNAFDRHMKLISQNATGVFELIPDELYFKHVNPTSPVVTHKDRWYQVGGVYERHNYVPSTAVEAYRLDGPDDLPALPGHLAGKVEAALAFKASISTPLPPGGANRTFVIYGAKHDTPCEAVMTDDGNAGNRGDVECTIGGHQGGDGTVPTLSGRGEPLWGPGVVVERDDGTEHFMMTETKRFHGILAQHLPRGRA